MRNVRSTEIREPNLDVLRAIAVLCVFFNHLGAGFGGSTWWLEFLGGLGRTGVVLFFVHTSLVLMQSLERRSAGNRPFVLEFYILRFFRIYPLAICAILGALFLRIPADWSTATAYVPADFAQVAANLLLIQNVVSQPPVISPLWSLPLEVQMYAVLPFLFALFASTPRWIRRMGIAWVVATVCALAMFYLTGHMNLLAYIPCFLSGVIAYRCRFAPRTLPFFLWPCLIVGLSLAGASLFTFHGENWNLAWEWPAALILGISWHRFAEVRRSGVVARSAHLVAEYSYGVYLWHYIVMFLVFYRLPLESAVLKILLATAGTAAATVLSFHCVEDPLISLGKRVAAFFRGGTATRAALVLSPANHAPPADIMD
jgi:peptidoglycan/LPS O-acetylase OafA/YrhL